MCVSGAHQYEPLSPILSFGVNPFPSRFFNRTHLRGGFASKDPKTQSHDSGIVSFTPSTEPLIKITHKFAYPHKDERTAIFHRFILSKVIHLLSFIDIQIPSAGKSGKWIQLVKKKTVHGRACGFPLRQPFFFVSTVRYGMRDSTKTRFFSRAKSRPRTKSTRNWVKYFAVEIEASIDGLLVRCVCVCVCVCVRARVCV